MTEGKILAHWLWTNDVLRNATTEARVLNSGPIHIPFPWIDRPWLNCGDWPPNISWIPQWIMWTIQENVDRTISWCGRSIPTGIVCGKIVREREWEENHANRLKVRAYDKLFHTKTTSTTWKTRGLVVRRTKRQNKSYKWWPTMLQMQGVWTLLWCPTRDKKISFIREKELTIMNKAKEGETTESTHEEEHLGASELPSCVIHRVYPLRLIATEWQFS